MHSEQEMELRAFLAERNINIVDGAVVESDWPEYETVWQMIEARCNGQAAAQGTADNARIAELEAALRRCAEIVVRHLYRQSEKVEDVKHIARAILEGKAS